MTYVPCWEQFPTDPWASLPGAIPFNAISENLWPAYTQGRKFLAGTNYLTNPGFEGTYASGIAPEWTEAHTTANAPTFSQVAGRTGGKAQRIQYTAVGGDAAAAIDLSANLLANAIVGGQPVYMSAYMKVGAAHAGVNVKLRLANYTNAWGALSMVQSDAFTLTDSWQLYELFGTLPATAYNVIPDLFVQDIANGDAVDITIDDALVARSPLAVPYFDTTTAGVVAGNMNAGASLAPGLLYSLSPTSGGLSIAALYAPLADDATAGSRVIAIVYDYAGHYVLLRDDANGVFCAAFDTADFAQSGIYAAREVGQRLVATARYSPTTLDVTLNGIDGNQAAHHSDGMTNLAVLQVGDYAELDWPANAYVGPAVIAPRCWSDEVNAAWHDNGGAALLSPEGTWALMEAGDSVLPYAGSTKGYLKTNPLTSAEQLLLVFDGNSLTAAAYPAACVADLSVTPAAWYNFAVGGQTTPQMTADAATQIDPLLAMSHSSAILVAWEWANDEQADLAARMVNMVTYCQARRTAGWKVIALTNSSNTAEAYLDFAGATSYIRANWPSFADAIADVAADPDIGVAGSYSDGTYFVDGIHMTAAGYAKVAAIVAPVIESLA